MIKSGIIYLSIQICLLLSTSSILVSPARAQDDKVINTPDEETSIILDRISDLILEEDASGLTDWASNPVDIAVFGASRAYSAAQGRYVLEKFFDSVDILSFTVQEYTQSEMGLFIEGAMSVPESRRSLRVYFRFTKVKEGWILRELIFEKASE
jgi:Domain of unknown function (DUF4783)